MSELTLRFRCASETTFYYGPESLREYRFQRVTDEKLPQCASVQNGSIEIRVVDPVTFIVGEDYYLEFSTVDGKIMRSHNKEID